MTYDSTSKEGTAKAGGMAKGFFDLNCTEYTSSDPNSSVSFITTNDILAPNSTKLNTDNGFIVQTTTTDHNLGFSFTIGLKSFSPVIVDTMVISIDTMGMNNMTNLSNEFLKAVREKKE